MKRGKRNEGFHSPPATTTHRQAATPSTMKRTELVKTDQNPEREPKREETPKPKAQSRRHNRIRTPLSHSGAPRWRAARCHWTALGRRLTTLTILGASPPNEGPVFCTVPSRSPSRSPVSTIQSTYNPQSRPPFPLPVPRCPFPRSLPLLGPGLVGRHLDKPFLSFAPVSLVPGWPAPCLAVCDRAPPVANKPPQD